MPEVADLPDSVRALRSDRHRIFAWFFMFNGGNGADAARNAGFSDASSAAKVTAHALLQRDDIQCALRDLGQKYLYALQPKALAVLGAMLGSKDDRVALKASDMVLSRTGMSERTALDVNVSGSVQVNHTDQAVEDLRRMVALGVPEEKLVETFGFSGLSRYRRLLEAKQKAEVIDADYEEVRE